MYSVLLFEPKRQNQSCDLSEPSSSRPTWPIAKRLSQLMSEKLGFLFQPIAQELLQGPAGLAKRRKLRLLMSFSEQASALVQDEEICEAIAAGVVSSCIESLGAGLFFVLG